MEMSHLEEKIADINLCWQPDLILADGRKAFVTGGPNRGTVVEPGLVLASGDLVAIDAEMVKVLLGYNARNWLLPDPWRLPQITAARNLGLGSGRNDYIVLD